MLNSSSHLDVAMKANISKLELVTKNNKKERKIILLKGDLVETSMNEAHAIRALKNSEFLVFTQGPRGGKEYENDTFRLNKPLIK